MDQTMQADELAEEVVALEHRLAEAEQAGNGGALRRLVAGDFSGFDDRGRRIDRTTFVEHFVGSETRIDSLLLQSLSVPVFDHIAVASGVSILCGFTHGHPVQHHHQFTDIWARRVMQWELVSEHVSLVFS